MLYACTSFRHAKHAKLGERVCFWPYLKCCLEHDGHNMNLPVSDFSSSCYFG